MADNDIGLMAHLMRRAGFGAARTELEALVVKGYEATVEELVQPENQADLEFDLMERYLPEYGELAGIESNQQGWIYRMINTNRPLQEKMTLFWHGIHCTGQAKVDHGRMMSVTIEMFRQHGMGNFRNLLVELSKHPAMVYFLDNVDNHRGNINENYGRELLELFSLGVGMDGQFNYTEDDVKAASRAFTGWSNEPTMPVFPFGRDIWKFRYDPTDHDTAEKTFLGETGFWNGEDIVSIIVRQPGTARYIARHLYNFFVADEPQIPAWKDTPPRDVEAIETLEKAFVDNDYEMRPVLRTLFNSDFFKNSRFQKIKSPTDVVIGTMRLVKDHTEVKPGLFPIMQETTFMGQDLMNPPTVEGWHTGKEWIDSGTLVERINFVADQVGNLDLLGVQLIIERMKAGPTNVSPEEFVDGCLDFIGPVQVGEGSRSSLIEYAKRSGEIQRSSANFPRRVAEMLQLIVATAEYQYA